MELVKSHECVRFVTYVIIGTEVQVYRKLKGLNERWRYLAENTFLGMSLTASCEDPLSTQGHCKPKHAQADNSDKEEAEAHVEADVIEPFLPNNRPIGIGVTGGDDGSKPVEFNRCDQALYDV